MTTYKTTTEVLHAAQGALELARQVSSRAQHAAAWDLKVSILRAVNGALETGGFDGVAYEELQTAKHLLNKAERVAGDRALQAGMNI